jgi:hypothetical protein
VNTLLVDKSAFQALNLDEMRLTSTRYQILATDVLLLELLGDLRYGDERTAHFARKIQVAETVVNMPYHLICGSELLGERVPMNQLPVLQGKRVVAGDGSVGAYIPPSEGDRALVRWSTGQFNDQDLEFARTWADAVRNFDLGFFERAVRGVVPRSQQPASIAEMRVLVDKSLREPARQAGFVECLLVYLPMSELIKRRIGERWSDPSRVLLRDAPFSAHCLRVLFVMFIAVGSRLLGTRNSNFIDAQYLMYLPFCGLFASGDAVHTKLFAGLASPGQTLLSPEELKAQLRAA